MLDKDDLSGTEAEFLSCSNCANGEMEKKVVKG